MRAADDLAGLRETPLPGAVNGVFTRAEEVGLEGARLVVESADLPPYPPSAGGNVHPA